MDEPQWPVDTEKAVYSRVIEATYACAGKRFIIFDQARIGNIKRFWAQEIGMIPDKYKPIVHKILADSTVTKDLKFLSSLGFETADQDSIITAHKEQGHAGPVQHFWFSPVGLDMARKWAAVFRGYACGDKRGFGIVILEFIKGKWVIVDDILFRND